MMLIRYIKGIFTDLWHLCQGLYISMLNFVRPKVTEQYPENRGEKVYFERFRGILTMPHDENNQHKCTACGICMNSCPNNTIRVVSKTVVDEETGRSKKILDRHLYNLGSCSFCELCTRSCPFDAIEFSNRFEHALYTKSKLHLQLNRPGSSLAPKPAKAAESPAPVVPQHVTPPSCEPEQTAITSNI